MNRTNQRKIHLHVKSLRQRFAALLLAFCCFALTLCAPASAGAAKVSSGGPIFSGASAAAAKVSSGEAIAAEYFDGILSYLAAADKRSSADPQVILDEGCDPASRLDLWYIFALAQHDAYDFRATARATRDSLLFLSSPLQGTTLQKYALVSLAIGDDLSPYDPSLLAESVGSQGIMSLVFGLHLLNNGASLSSHTPQETVRRILALRLADGGWAITGEFGDVDVTSMVVQALAPYCRSAAGSSDAEAAAAIDGAIALLSSRQNADGGFTSYGSANCESCVQVLVALSSVGIDASSDARFLKNGKSVFDAIASYRMPDGSFRHIQSGETNRTATQQVFYGCVAYLRFLSGRPSLYELDAVREGRGLVPTGAPSATVTPVAALTPTAAVASPTAAPAVSPAVPAKTGANGSGIPPYRLIGTGVIIFLCGIAFAVLGAKKRLTKRNDLLAAFSAIVLLVLLWIVKIQTPSQYYAELGVSEEEAAGVVTLSVRCDTVAGENGLPADGVILAPVRVPFREGDTVYNALTVAAASAGLPLDVGGLGTGGYIRGIGTLREFDFGSLSGWMYYVNGEAPSESCNSRRLADGDVIEWRYTRDLGADTE
ncbi:MAG: DUF4430 domain-containing protein [Lachnospiraceae bacterium]|nr:DUF4430 domain-containing protein [Lachnospiraceae bacterium]